MIMISKVSILRQLIVLLLLFGFCSGAFAGADPAPTDWLPIFNKISFEGNETVFDAGGTQIRLPKGQWGNSASSPINTLSERHDSYVPKVKACSVPEGVLSKYRNGYNQPEIWSCDLPEKIWFASGGYCGEGDDDPESTQGHLYSYTPTSGVVVQYPDFLPKCAELAGLERVGNLLVAVTIYQGEYGQGAGDVIILDLENQKVPPKVWKSPKPTGAVVGMSAYDNQCDCLWFATANGIERLTVSSGKWEQRYFDFEISHENRLVLTLSLQKQNDAKMWMGRMIHNNPIEDVRGFVKAWNQSPVPQYAEHPRTGPLLLPFYIAAVERAGEWKNDWTYAELVRVVAAHQDIESRKLIRAMFEKQLKQPMSLSKRGEIISKAKLFNVEHAQEMEDTYYDRLLPVYFIRQRPDYSNHTISLFFEHPEYLPKLMDFYKAHLLTFEVEKYFLDEVSSHTLWMQYDIVSDAIFKGNERLEHRLRLLDMCARNETPSEENKLLAILQARLETDSQAKLMNDPSVDSREDQCINASYYWISYGGGAQVRKRTELMLALAAERKEFGPVILESLNRKYATPYTNIDEWRRWWNSYAPPTNTFH